MGLNLMEPKEIDFYAILNIPRDATFAQIAVAYRKLAIKYHPHRDKDSEIVHMGVDHGNHLPALQPSIQWCYINRAYDVLSNPLRREIYDRYGETGLQKGVPLPHGYFQPYHYHGDYLKTYHEVFGSYSPYADLIEAAVNPPPLYTSEKGVFVKKKDPPVEKLLYLDLKDVYFGGVKRMKIIRHELFDRDNGCSSLREKILVIPVTPGILPGTRITFPEEGDRTPGRIPADIIFIVTDRPHNIFLRRKSDLFMEHAIDLKDALCGVNILIHTIDDRKLFIQIADVIHPQYVHEVKGEGLPIPNSNGEKGNLYVRFDMKFPSVIPKAIKPKIVKLFNEIETDGGLPRLTQATKLSRI